MQNKYIEVKILNNKINQSFTYMVDLSLYNKLEYGDLLLVKFNNKFQIAFYIKKSTAKILYDVYPVLKVLKKNRITKYGHKMTNYMFENTFNHKEDIANMLINKNEVNKNKLEIILKEELHTVDEYVNKYIKSGHKLANKDYIFTYFQNITFSYNKVKKEHLKLFEYLYKNEIIDIDLERDIIKKIKVYKNKKDNIYLTKQDYMKKYNLTIYKFNKFKDNKDIQEKDINSYEYIGDIEDRKLIKYELTKYQDLAYRNIKKTITNKPILLRGITGSGKTSIFINLIEDYLKEDMQVLLLVPEMILAKQIIKTVEDVFGNICGYYSQDITSKQKVELLENIKSNKVKIIVGTRSSIFLDIPKLSLVIVDEEHDTSYKQNFYPYYNIHDLIDFYNQNNIHVLLSSATPLVSTYAKAKKGLYELVELTKRYNDYSTPNIIFKNYDKDNLINEQFIKYINDSLNQKQKVLILFNVKGYSKTVECGECYDIVTCPNCNIPLKYYKDTNSCECSYCDYKIVNYSECKSCGSRKINYVGLGIEKVESELRRYFKDKVLRIDSKVSKTKVKINKIIKEFNENDNMILLGTQIISKGLNFPNLNKVIVLNLDNMLYFDDFAAYEKTYQLVEQVSGRSGRNEADGEVIIYTNHEDNYVYKSVLNHDYESFYEKEMLNRKLGKNVPYYYIAQIEFRNKDIKECKAVMMQIKEFLNINYESLIVTNVIKPYIVKIGDDYRYKLYIKYKRENVRSILNECINELQLEKLNLLIDLKIIDYGY